MRVLSGLWAVGCGLWVGFAWAQDPTGVIAKPTKQETFESPKFGTVHVYIPASGIKHVALFADGDGGWNLGINDMAQLLANEGTLVAGISTVPYLAKLSASNEKCGYMAADFEDLGHAVEKRYALKSYTLPTLVGYSSGASLVYAALAQAPKGTFRGAVTLGFCDDLADTHAICRGRGLATKLNPKKTLSLLAPMKELGQPWAALQGDSDQACSLADLQTFTKDIESAKVVGLEKVGHGFQSGKRWHRPYVSEFLELQKSTATCR
jgi:type IV secretory pathway VirJ component